MASASGENYIAIFSRNCPDWVIVEQACYDYSLAVVGLYDTCGTDSLVDIINDSKVTVVVCGDRPQELCDALKVCPSIKVAITYSFYYLFGGGGGVENRVVMKKMNLEVASIELFSFHRADSGPHGNLG